MNANRRRAQDSALPSYNNGMSTSSGVAPANMNYYQNGVCQSVPAAQMPLMAPPTIMQVPVPDAQMMMYPPQHVQQFGQGSYLLPVGYPQAPMYVYPQRTIAYGSQPGGGLVSSEQFHVGSPPIAPPPKSHHGGHRGTTHTGRGRGGGRNRGGGAGHWNRETNQQGRQQLQEPPSPSYYHGSYGYELGVYCPPPPPQEIRINEVGFPAVLQTQSGQLYVYNRNPTPTPQTEERQKTPFNEVEDSKQEYSEENQKTSFTEVVNFKTEYSEENQKTSFTEVEDSKQEYSEENQKTSFTEVVDFKTESSEERQKTPFTEVEDSKQEYSEENQKTSFTEVVNSKTESSEERQKTPFTEVEDSKQEYSEENQKTSFTEVVNSKTESSEERQKTPFSGHSVALFSEVVLSKSGFSPKRSPTVENSVSKPPETIVAEKVAKMKIVVADNAATRKRSTTPVSRITTAAGVVFVNSKYKDARGGFGNKDSKLHVGKQAVHDKLRGRPAPFTATTNKKETEGGTRRPGHNPDWKPSVPKFNHGPVKSVGITNSNGPRNGSAFSNRSDGTGGKLPSKEASGKMKSGGSPRTEEFPELASNAMKRNAYSTSSRGPLTTSSSATVSSPPAPETRSWARIVSQGASDDNNANPTETSASNTSTEMADKASGDSAVPGLDQWRHGVGVKRVGSEGQKL